MAFVPRAYNYNGRTVIAYTAAEATYYEFNGATLDGSPVPPVVGSRGVTYDELYTAIQVALDGLVQQPGGGLTEAQVIALLQPYIDPDELTAVLAAYATGASLASALTNYATTTSVTSAIATALAAIPPIDLTPYAKTVDVNAARTTALEPYAKTADVNAARTTALEPYAKTADVNAARNTALQDYVASATVDYVVTLTQSAYDALSSKDSRTLYVITG